MAALPLVNGTGDTGGPRGGSAPRPILAARHPFAAPTPAQSGLGAALPIGVYFLVRRHVHSDAQALIVAGGFSAAWVILQFVRQRRVDVVGAVVLSGFAVGVVSSTLLGGNEYVLKVRDAGFTALFGVICIVTLFTHDRPALFYVGRYLSVGSDPAKVSAFDRLHEVPMGRHAFRVLSVLWGIGLVVEASTRMVFADVLPTGTFLAGHPSSRPASSAASSPSPPSTPSGRSSTPSPSSPRGWFPRWSRRHSRTTALHRHPRPRGSIDWVPRRRFLPPKPPRT